MHVALIGPAETHDVTAEVAEILRAAGFVVDVPPELAGTRLTASAELERLLADRLVDTDVVLVVESPAAAASRWVDAERRTAQAAGRHLVGLDVAQWRAIPVWQRPSAIAALVQGLSRPPRAPGRGAPRAARSPAIREWLRALVDSAPPFTGRASAALDSIMARATAEERDQIERIRRTAHAAADARSLELGEIGAGTAWATGDPDSEVLELIWEMVRDWSPQTYRVTRRVPADIGTIVEAIVESRHRNMYLVDRCCRVSAARSLDGMRRLADREQKLILDELRREHGDEDALQQIDRCFDDCERGRYQDFIEMGRGDDYDWRYLGG